MPGSVIVNPVYLISCERSLAIDVGVCCGALIHRCSAFPICCLLFTCVAPAFVQPC